MNDFFNESDVISVYTRSEAFADGELIDLTTSRFNFRENLNICKEAGLCPVAMTRAAYCLAVEDEENGLPPCQDLSGRLWDVLYMLRIACVRRGENCEDLVYSLFVRNWILNNGQKTSGTRLERVTLKAMFGIGDSGEAVITIMLPDED